MELVTGLTEEELTAQALAADPDPVLGPDARPFRPDGAPAPELLPAWYMPAPAAGRSTPARRAVALGLVAAAIVINALGFCITYGTLSAG